MNPLVSVIIPVYNVENYIRECVKSVSNQVYDNIEVILVDDGSTDSSGTICNEIASEIANVCVVHKTNGGLSSARNAGMLEAKGDYFFFLDSDDYIPMNAINALVESILNSSSEIAICQMERTSKRDLDSNISTKDINKNILSAKEALVRMLYGDGFSTSACGKLFKREVFENIEFPDGKFSEDLFTIYKTILKCKSICYIEMVGYYYYYRNEGSIVVSKYSSKHIEAIDAVDNISRDAVNMGNTVSDAVASQYINVIYDIASRNPKISEFKDKRIIEPLKSSRRRVVKNKKSPARLRLFAVVSYLGPFFAIKSVFVYNYLKWKISKV